MSIVLKNIEKTINGITVLKNINLQFEYGVVYGLKGKNGSGKTMLMKTLCGLVIPSKGTIEIDKINLTQSKCFPESIGALIEAPAFLPEYTGRGNLKALAQIGKEKIETEEIDKVITMVGLDSSDKRTYRKYSLGMKQRLGIAAAIMGYPKIVVLDEPSNALDVDGIALLHTICDELKKHECMVILSCHDAQELEELSDVIITIVQGEVTDWRENNESIM
ncbi:MAG: ATP-binding cassette domain-containing protein [Anaerovoracaceae bacterium]